MTETPDYDIIEPETAGSLPGLFSERVRRTPDLCAYRFFDAINGVWSDVTWEGMAGQVAAWRQALAQERLQPGDRVAIMARNSRFWVIFDQAAMSLGLVVVPLYTEDRADNVAYILAEAGAKLLVIGGDEQWSHLAGRLEELRDLRTILSIAEVESGGDKRVRWLAPWLQQRNTQAVPVEVDGDALATIVYTSGTTGRPKGVMLSHRNILSNAYGSLRAIGVAKGEIFLSFLPLSHTLERTIGYYLPMMAGATVAHARGIPELAKDLQIIRPTALISVPRIYERVYARIKDRLAMQSPLARRMFEFAVNTGWRRFEWQQGRGRWHASIAFWPLLRILVAEKILQRLGGRLKAAVSGGAALAPDIARVFIGLGVPILQGYGLTEASPVISVNRLDDNIPASIGVALEDVEVAIGDDDELLARGPNIMLGYWHNEEASNEVLESDGWLHTGDKARIEGHHIHITGRIKEIIVLANGEKVPPVDMELAIAADNLFDQVMIIGEGCPFLAALLVVSPLLAQKFLADHGLQEFGLNSPEVENVLLERISRCLHEFPGYASIYRVWCSDEPWTIENGLLTPTHKLKRAAVQAKYAAEIDRIYSGHSDQN